MFTYFKKNFAITSSFIILIGAVITFLGMFFSNFNGEVSNSQQDWGAFGSYISGTIGVLAACLAVVWLMISVHLQKVELQHLKSELASSADEQKKQTYISALTALISSSRQAITEYQNDLMALNNGSKHLHPMVDKVGIFMSIDEELMKLKFYQEQIAIYLKEQYVDPYPNKGSSTVSDDIPF
ncbi:hypothetical protein CMT41_07095 [Colwellia sp. MT41]|uniref:hypothetical protein n=1 Tax=Colwellia sp. MT41 TaxID=58049 RepID=UPI0007175625|nr:hypothetical protein [Colwellia sp. MT41]ALO34507.1 hypothetical protein CMT41_07095 [Colwellia sp. MT41]